MTVDWAPKPADLPPSLRQLSIGHDDPFLATHDIPITNMQLRDIATACQHLVTLTLNGVDFQEPCDLVSFHNLEELYTSTLLGPLPRSLKHLTVDFFHHWTDEDGVCWNNNCSLNLEQCINLESLSLMYIPGSNSEFFQIDFSRFPRLTYLDVGWDGGHLPVSLVAIPPVLKTARFQECTLSNQILENLPLSLESLELDSCEGFDGRGIASLSRLVNLTRLSVGYEWFNTYEDADPIDLSMASVLEVVASENMNVRTLGLDCWGNVMTNENLLSLKNLSTIHHLSLRSTTLTDSQLQDIMKNMPHLSLMRVSSDVDLVPYTDKVKVTKDKAHPTFLLTR